MDKTGKSILMLLRHLGRLSEVRLHVAAGLLCRMNIDQPICTCTHITLGLHELHSFCHTSTATKKMLWLQQHSHDCTKQGLLYVNLCMHAQVRAVVEGMGSVTAYLLQPSA